MIRPVLALAAFSLLAVPVVEAQAQRAPITRGATSGDLATTVSQLRQQMAQMSLDIARLEDEIGRLNGEIETLEFLLSQSRDESARMQEDDQRIGETLRTLSEQNDRLQERISGLERQMDGLASGAVEEGGEPRETAGARASSEPARPNAPSPANRPGLKRRRQQAMKPAAIPAIRALSAR